jgi:Primase X
VHKVTIAQQQRKQLVLEGIELILSLFVVVGQQRLFPRTIMTRHTKGQIVVNSKEEVVHYFEIAGYEDCRLNAYPAFLSKAEEQDYKKGINLNLFAPNILFIDLDAKRFKSGKELQRALRQIVKNIAYLLHGVKPLVLWSGHGYHIIVAVKATETLEQFEHFRPYTNEPSKEFLQFAEHFLSLSKADPANNPSFKSCLLRVPYTFNSKCIEEGMEDAEVKIVQQWDSSQQLQQIDNLLVEFQTYLIDKRLKAEVKEEKTVKNRHYSCNSADLHNTIPYIEKLLNQSLEDYRKAAISLILAPYFVNVQRLTDADSFSRIKEWVLKCNLVKKLEPSLDYFDDLINRAIERAKETGIKPLKFEETLKYKNTELYNLLH